MCSSACGDFAPHPTGDPPLGLAGGLPSPGLPTFVPNVHTLATPMVRTGDRIRQITWVAEPLLLLDLE